MEFNLPKPRFSQPGPWKKTWCKIDLDVIDGSLGTISYLSEMGDLILGTATKRFYVRASDPKRRLKNLNALAWKYWLGNFSAMVNDALNQVYNLDPDTGEENAGERAGPNRPTLNKKKRRK